MVKFTFLFATSLFAGTVFALPVDVYQRSFELSTSDLDARDYLAQALVTREEQNYERSMEEINDDLYLRSFSDVDDLYAREDDFDFYAQDGTVRPHPHLSKKAKEAVARINEKIMSFIPGFRNHQQPQH